MHRVPVTTYVRAWDQSPQRRDGRTSFTTPLFVYPKDRATIASIVGEKRFFLSDAKRKLEEKDDNGQVSEGSLVELTMNKNCEVTAPTDHQTSELFLNDEKPTYDELYNFAKLTIDASASIGIVQVFRALLETRDEGGTEVFGELGGKLEVFDTVKEDAEQVLLAIQSMARKSANSTFMEEECFGQQVADVPKEFVDKVSIASGDEGKIWNGAARTYQAQPTERVQRISSVASAANSMQLAFSLAAILPGQGLGVETGAAAAKTAIGMVEAIERTPIVVGYTDRSANGRARFGYIFGPKAVLDAPRNSLIFVQQAKSYPVFADITVPAWWPAIRLTMRSAWIENWHSGRGVLKEDKVGQMESKNVKSIEVRLRPRLADAGPLTQFILDNSLISDLDAPRITEIYPNRVSVCGTGRLVFTIEGENLWRSPVAYLRGKRHESIRVLPDMRGLAVTFDLHELPDRPERGASQERITVWTTLGSEHRDVELVDTRLGVPCKGGTATDASVISLHSHYSYLVGGKDSTIRVDMVQPLPRVARKARVVYQFATRNGLGTVHKIDNTKIYGGRFVEGNATVQKPANMTSREAEEGPSIRVGLQYQTTDDGVYPILFGRMTPLCSIKMKMLVSSMLKHRNLTQWRRGLFCHRRLNWVMHTPNLPRKGTTLLSLLKAWMK